MESHVARLDIAHRRLASLRLSGASFERPEDAVRWLGAAQSQDYAGGKWAVAQRMADGTDAALDTAFADGAFLRTHVLRPTWHFVTPEDIRWLLALTGPRVHALNAFMYRRTELDDALFARSTDILVKALEGGNHRTRDELAAALEGAGVPLGGFRLTYILMRAELDALVCSGPLRGKSQTYALLSERAPRARTLDHDEALRELTLRYFTSHGPATVKDFTWWSSLTVADARRGLEMARGVLVSEVVDGLTYWSAPDAPVVRDPSPTVHLLQGYDEYIVGYSESKGALNIADRTTADLQYDVPFIYQVLLDSQVIGNWKRAFRKKAAVLTMQLVRAMNSAEKAALDAAAQRYGAFMEMPVSLEVA
jgi:hypothetical protein